MKILHTSDWHIGKKLIRRDRSEEFRAVLGEIAGICKNEGVELCLVAGDIFDTYTPSAEAESIFFETVTDISKVCSVLIISGNHDDYVRLTASATLAQEHNVYIVGNNLRAIKCAENGKCYPVLSDKGYVVFENTNGERVYINTLPYPNEARFKEGKSEQSFEEKISRWIDYGERGKAECGQKLPSIFLSHIFVCGGKAGDTEREIDLGGARLVPQNALPECDYVALGHLHKRQKVADNAYYSGAIMRFSFDESNSVKSVNVFDITDKGVSNFKQIELKSIKCLMRLQALDVNSGVKLLNDNSEAYVELTLNLKEPLSRADVSLLNGCANLVSLKTELEREIEEQSYQTKKDKSASELFTSFYNSRFGCEPPDGLKELFLELTEEL